MASGGSSPFVRRLNLALLGVGLVGLAVLVATIDRTRLTLGLRQLGLGVLLASLLHGAALFADAVLLVLCGPRALTGRFLLRAFRASLAGHAVGLALHLGDVTKFTLLRDEVDDEPLAAALLLQNLLWFEANCLLIVVGGFLAPPALDLRGTLAAGLQAVAALFLVLGVGTPIVLRTGPWRWPFAVLLRVQVPPARVEAARAFVDRMAEAMRVWSRRRGRALVAATFALLSRVLSSLEVGAILAFLGVAFHPLVPFLSLMNAQIVFWLTVFVPFQIGTAEAGQYFFYQAIGQDPALGVVVELTRKAIRIVFVVIGLSVMGLETLRRVRGKG